MDTNKYWRYGDLNLFRSKDQPYRYLSARSLIEEQVYFLQVINNDIGVTYYDNFSECLFQIIPNLQYEVIKNYQKLLKEKQINTEKLEILKKRVENEEAQNQLIIQKYRGKAIRIGDFVHIRHYDSKCYIKASSEKNIDIFKKHQEVEEEEEEGQQPLMNLKLQDTIDSYVSFKIKIDPYLSFKSEGEKLTYEDTFYFENNKFKSIVSYLKSQKLNLKYKLNNHLKNEEKIHFPSIMERSIGFNILQASHMVQEAILDIFSVIPADKEIPSSEDALADQINQGDFVRIKHILKDTKKLTYINCEYNVCGTYNVPVIALEDPHDSNTVSSIFQIVPEEEIDVNRLIEFNQEIKKDVNVTSVILRHWLTGKYLKLPKEYGEQIKLCHSFDEYLTEHNLGQEFIQSGQENQQTIKPFGYGGGRAGSSNRRVALIAKPQPEEEEEEDEDSGSGSNDSSHSHKKKKKEKVIKSDIQSMINRFLNEIKVNLKPAQKDQALLQNLSSFSMLNADKEYDLEDALLVEIVPFDENGKGDSKHEKGWLGNKNCYEQIPKEVLQPDEVYYCMESSENFSFFFFELVETKEINSVQSVQSKIYPIMVLCACPEILNEKEEFIYVENAFSNLVKICHWLCNLRQMIKFEGLITQKPEPHKQNILREVGLIEMVMKIVYHMNEYNLLSDAKHKNKLICSFCIVIVIFLRLSCQNNRKNSFFIFQWYQYIKNIILITKALPIEIELDSLLQEIFNITQLNIQYILKGDVNYIVKFLKFEQLNNQGLNLLLSFCTYNKDIESDKTAFKIIVEEVLQKNRNILFRDFIYNKNYGKLAIKMSGDEIKYIDQDLEQKESSLFKYLTSSMSLLSEISKGDAGLIIEYLKIICPFQTCIQTFNNNSINQKIKALFMDMFLNSYLTYDSRYSQQLQFPDYLKMKPGLNISEKTDFQIKEQRSKFEQKYCNLNPSISDETSNLKNYLFLEALELKKMNIVTSDNHRIMSTLEMIDFFIKKNFCNELEIQYMHKILDDFLKNSYTFLVYQKDLQEKQKKNNQNIFSNDAEFDIQEALKWIVKTLECLYFIEQYEQNCMIEKFFTLENGQVQFSESIEQLMSQNKELSQNELKNKWQEIQRQKQDLVQQFMLCLEIPDTEVIYYYLRILDFSYNPATQIIVKLIYQIFSMRANIFQGFNDVFFVYENNINDYNLLVEQYHRIQIQLVDLKNSQGDEKDSVSFTEQYNKIELYLNLITDNIIIGYIALKNDDLYIQDNLEQAVQEEKHNCVESDKSMKIKFKLKEVIEYKTDNTANTLVHGPVKQKLGLGQMLIKKKQQTETAKVPISHKDSQQSANSSKLPHFQKNLVSHDDYMYKIYELFEFDIRNSEQRQDLFRHLKLHKLLMEIIMYISNPNQIHFNQKLKKSILESSLLLLIFFCVKNFKNQNIITGDVQFQAFIEDLQRFQYQNSQIYILLFISELFKDNYYLLIKLEKDQEKLIRNLQKNFSLTYEKSKRYSLQSTRQFNYCIYYIQLLHTFFKIKSANLIQNQIFIFNQINEQKMTKICQKILEQCIKTKVDKHLTMIEVPDDIVLLFFYLNLHKTLLQAGKSYGKIIYEAKLYFPLSLIKNILQNMEDWYFIKQELLEIVVIVYIQNKKKEEEEIQDLKEIFQEIIIRQLDICRENSVDPNQKKRTYYSDFKNIFNITNQYSTPDYLINISVADCQNYYIIYGIMESFMAYANVTFIDLNSKNFSVELLDLYNNTFEKFNLSLRCESELKALILNEIHRQQDPTITSSKKQRTDAFLSANRLQSQNDEGIGSFMTEKEQEFQEKLKKFKQTLNVFFQSQQFCRIQRDYEKKLKSQSKQDNTWETYKMSNQQIIDDETIEKQHLLEMDMLIGILIKMRCEDVTDFKKVVTNFVNLLTNKDTQPIVQEYTIRILRHLANFKGHEVFRKNILQDLCDMGYTEFLCAVISKNTIDFTSKFEYIIALVDFLDEGEQVQASLMQFMLADKENNFICAIYSYIQINFNDFKEYEKGLIQRNLSRKIKDELGNVIKKKMECCIQAIWILKMACEGHYTQMQLFLRQQNDRNGEIMSNNKNFIIQVVDIFGQYMKLISQENSEFGEKILDFLIELIQGPCYENQYFLCETKILENLEDLIFELSEESYNSQTLKLKYLRQSSFTKRIYIFLLSLFEGTSDPFIIDKVQSFLQPQVMFKRLMFIYTVVLNPKISNDKILKTIRSLIKAENIEKEKIHDEEKEEEEDEEEKVEEVKPPQGETEFQEKTKIHKQTTNLLTNDQQNEDVLNLFSGLNALNAMLGGEENEEITLMDIDEEYGVMIEDLKQESQNIYILLRSMAFLRDSFKDTMKKAKKEMRQSMKKTELDILYRTNMYFKLNTGRIEIINEQNQIQLLFFHKPGLPPPTLLNYLIDISKYLSESTKEYFLQNVERSQANDKINGLMQKTNDFIDEMNHFKFIMNNIPLNLDKLFTTSRSIVLINSFIINSLLLFDFYIEPCVECEGKYGYGGEDDEPCVCPIDTPSKLNNVIYIFGLLLFFFNVLNFVIWACLKLKIDLLSSLNSFDNLVKEQKKINKYKLKSEALLDMPVELIKATELMQEYMQEYVYKYIFVFHYMAFNSYFMYLSLYAAWTILGIFANRIFYSFLLLDIIQRSTILQNIIAAITTNINQLGMTGLLGLVVMFIFGMVGYYNQTIHGTMKLLQDTQPICYNPMNCYMFVLNIGMRQGGGVGDALDQPHPNKTLEFTARFFYDLSFYLLIIIVWFNVIYGIILDTFAQLRAVRNQQDFDRMNNCFICNIDKTIFEKNNIFFEEHTEKQHNIWNYFYYMVHLQLKDSMDYTGIESLICDKIEKDDISWFPIGKAQILENCGDEVEDQSTQQIQKIDQDVQNIINSIKKSIQSTKNDKKK